MSARAAVRIFALLLLSIAEIGAADSVPPEKPAMLCFESGRLRMKLLDPSEPPDRRKTGCRFLRAGWIAELYPDGVEQSVFHRRFWFHRPMYGFAFEFFPQLKLDAASGKTGDEYLQLGVGIVAIEDGRRFDAVPVKLFDWQRIFRVRDGTMELLARQSCRTDCGYAYEMAVRVALPKDSDTVRFEIVLRNTGNRPIDTELYAHPFFNALNGFADSWFSLPGRPERESVREAANSLEVSGTALPKTANMVSAGNLLGRGVTVDIRGIPDFNRVEFWKNADNCFAVEPFWTVSLRPGEQKSWNCLLTVQTSPR